MLQRQTYSVRRSAAAEAVVRRMRLQLHSVAGQSVRTGPTCRTLCTPPVGAGCNSAAKHSHNSTNYYGYQNPNSLVPLEVINLASFLVKDIN